jgi:hypothetical protein
MLCEPLLIHLSRPAARKLQRTKAAVKLIEYQINYRGDGIWKPGARMYHH